MTGGQPKNHEVDAIIQEAKVITANLSWRRERTRYKLEASALAIQSGILLQVRGNVGIRNRSYALLLRGVCIRRFCTNPYHRNPGGTPISSPHKHEYDELLGDDQAYIPDDIQIGDVNGELFGFLNECNITLEGNYQGLIA